jgi:hypothetical protein
VVTTRARPGPVRLSPQAPNTAEPQPAPAQRSSDRLRQRNADGLSNPASPKRVRRNPPESTTAARAPRAGELPARPPSAPPLQRLPLSACDRLLAKTLTAAATDAHAKSANAGEPFGQTLRHAADVRRRAYRGEDLSLAMSRALEAAGRDSAPQNAQQRDAGEHSLREAALDVIEATDQMPHSDLSVEEVNHLYRVIEFGDYDIHALKDKLTAEASLEARDAKAKQPVVLTEVPLDSARTAFVPNLQPGLSDEQARAQVLKHRALKDAIVVHHPMEHVPRMDHVFPLRDLNNPLDRVHPRFADAQGRLHPRVSVQRVQVPPGTLKLLNQLNRQSQLLPPDKSGRAVQMSDRQLNDMVKALQRDVQEQMKNLSGRESDGPSDGGGRSPPRCTPRVLTREDVQPNEQMLIGQHGLFLDQRFRDGDAAELPLLCNGRILGFYAGALIDEGEQQQAAVKAQVPDWGHYALTAREQRGEKPAVVYHALGAGNSMAMANTALQADKPEPEYDAARINALFVRMDVGFTDKHGEAVDLPVMAVVALANLVGPGNPQRQIYLDYGADYLPNFKDLASSTGS